MTKNRMGRWIVLITASLLSLLLIAANGEAAERTVVMDIQGMDCELCTIAVKKSLEEVKGVRTVKVSFKDKRAWITTDGSVADAALVDAVKKAGPYKARIIGQK